MGDTLHKMQVVIEASTASYKKEMEDAKKVTKNVSDSVRSETEKVKQAMKMDNVTEPVKKQLSIMQKLKRSITAMQLKTGIKSPTKEYTEAVHAVKTYRDNIESTTKTLDRYYSKRDKMVDLGVDQESRSWKSLEYDIKNAEAQLERYKRAKAQAVSQKAELVSNDNAFKRTRETAIPRQALNFGRTVAGGSIKGMMGLGKLGIGAAQKGWGGFTKLLGGTGNLLSPFAGVIQKCSGAFAALLQKFTSGIPLLNRTKSSFNGLGTSGRGLIGILKTIGMTAKFMFASFVIRGAVDGAKQGFQDLAQYSGETNKSLSLLMSSLTQLKNSLATAFAPILNVITPILNSFIQTLINVVNAIGQLMGALTGKTTMVTAKKVNQDYASSLDTTSKNADSASKSTKQYQRTLLGFDQINKLNDDPDNSGSTGTGSSTGLSPKDMFETTTINSKFKDLAKLLKDAWKNADFTEIGAMVGEKLNKALESIPWDKIQKTCNKIAKSIATFLNGFIETTDWKLVGKTFSRGLNTVFGFVDTFAKNFHWKSLGKAIGNGINGAVSGFDWSLIKRTVRDTVSGVINTLNTAIATTNWSKVGKTIGECFNTRLEAIYTAVHNFNWSGVGIALADLVTNTIKTIDTGKIGQIISDKAKGTFDLLISAIEHVDWWSMGDTVYNKVKDFLVNIDWSGIASRVFEAIGAAFGGLAAFIGGVFKNAVADAKKYIIKHFTESGKFTWEGFKNGVLQSFKGVASWIKTHIFAPFLNGLKKAFGIHSPSTVMYTQGGYIIAGLFNGMKAGLPAVLAWVSKLPEWTKNKLGNAKNWLQGKGKDAITGLKNGYESVKESTFLSRVSKLPSYTKNRLGNAKAWLQGKGKDAITGLKNGWEAVKESTFLSRVRQIGTRTYNAIGNIQGKVTPKGRDIIKGMKSGFSDNWSTLSGALSSIPNLVSRAIPSLFDVGRDVMLNFANGFASIHIPMPHIGWDWSGGSLSLGNLRFSLPRFNVNWYANGGFPDMGEMFVARESGPELVGRMGNRSAVANNNQIIAGIRAGVFEAVVNAFESMQGRSDRGQELHVYLEGDAKKLFKVIRQEGNNYQKQTGNPVFG